MCVFIRPNSKKDWTLSQLCVEEEDDTENEMWRESVFLLLLVQKNEKNVAFRFALDSRKSQLGAHMMRADVRNVYDAE